MFDLRYHVASLAAVFLALIIGILVGVGIADRGLLDKGTKRLLQDRIAVLQNQLDNATQRTAAADREQRALQSYVKETYPVLVRNRLRGRHVAVVFVGDVKGDVSSAVERALTDAGAQETRLRALKVPIDVRQVDARLVADTEGKSYVGNAKLESLGRALGEELVSGGDTPLWNALTETLVGQRDGSFKAPVDGVVVVRTVPPQQDGTSRLLLGLYQGLGSRGLPAVGVEKTDAHPSAVQIFGKGGLSTVDDVDEPTGKLALVLLLGGAQGGHYGVKQTADDILPPFPNLLGRGG
jgi:Copper transport outer membrane protein, MctB